MLTFELNPEGTHLEQQQHSNFGNTSITLASNYLIICLSETQEGWVAEPPLRAPRHFLLLMSDNRRNYVITNNWVKNSKVQRSCPSLHCIEQFGTLLHFVQHFFAAAAQWWWTTPGITSLPSRERPRTNILWTFKTAKPIQILKSIIWSNCHLSETTFFWWTVREPRELHHNSPRPRTNNSLDFNRDFRYWCNSFLRSHHCIEHDHFLRSIDFNIANIHRTVGAHSNAKNTIESTFLWQWWDIGWYVLGFHPFRAGDFPHLWEICLYIQCTTLHQSASTALHHRHH